MTDPRTSDLDQAVDVVRGSLDTPAARNLILALLYLRVSDPEQWEFIRSSRGSNIADSLRNNPAVRDLISRPGLYEALPARALAQLVETINKVARQEEAAAAFERILESFASLGRPRDGGVYTPRSVTQTVASVLDTESATSFFDPACGSGELLVAATENAVGLTSHAVAYGSAIDAEALHVARINLALHGVTSNISLRDRSGYSGLFDTSGRYSRVLSNPPFSTGWSDFHPEPVLYARQAKGRADFSWLDYAIRSIEPDGRAAIVMPNGTLFSANRYDTQARQGMVEDGCVEGVIALPPSLFYETRIPICVWLLVPPGSARDQILLIDASAAGHMASRTRREISCTEIAWITETITTWRSGRSPDLMPHATAVPLGEAREMNYNLSPSVYMRTPSPGAEMSATALSVEQLMNRLVTLEEAAHEKDAAVEQIFKGLKW